MRMKEMKAPEKIAQKMTRDGAVAENMVIGEVNRISHREAEADFSAPEEEISFGSPLEQAAHTHARHQEHKAAKKNADFVREGSGARKRPSSRLHFSEEERADPALQKYIRRSDRAADKLDDAKAAIPTKTVRAKERVFDEATGKGRISIRFEKVEKKPNGKLRQNPLSRPVQEITHAAHNEVRKVEQENVGVEALLEVDKHCDTVAKLINLTGNLDCYEFQPNISDYEDLGRWDLYERSEFTRSMVEALEDYIDFEAYGHDVAQGEGGKLVECCYVFPSGSEFYEEYNGDFDTIPDEYVVYTPDLLNLDPDEKLAWAIPLAISLDSFFREFDSGYAEQHPDISAQQEFLCDSLVDGKIAAIDKRLSDMGQTEQDALPSELADFKRLSGYDPETENLPETMKVLVVEPRQPPRVKEIPSGLEGLTDAVGGPISAIYPFHDPVVLICNEEGRNMGLELNRALYNGMGQVYDVIPGTFVIAGLTDDSFTSLPEDMIEKYSRRFQTIEVYAQVGNRTGMFQVPQDTAELSDQCWDSVIREKLGQKPSIRESLAAAKEECAGKSSPERIHKRSEHEL